MPTRPATRRVGWSIGGLLLVRLFAPGMVDEAGGSPSQGVRVSGDVQDATGGALPGTAVVLIDQATGDRLESFADDEGRFAFEEVGDGQYQLEATQPGFHKATFALTILGRPQTNLRVRLDVLVADVISVTPDPRSETALQAARNADSLSFDDDLLRELPLPTDSKALYDFVANYFSRSAQGTDELTVLVDGAETTRLNLPTFAVRRVLINSNPFSAEYRRPGKARIKILTQDGSRRYYRGGLGMALRDSRFDAREAFATEKPALDRRRFEATIGGPIPRSHLTFFMSGEQLRGQTNQLINAATLDGPWVQNVTARQSFDYVLGRLDGHPSATTTWTVRFDFTDERKTNQQVGEFNLPEQAVSERDWRRRLHASVRTFAFENVAHDAQIVYELDRSRAGETAAGPQIEVVDAFVGGPSQIFERQRATILEAREILTYFRGRHTVRAGARVRPKFVSGVDASNFGGTFEFASLASFASAQPEVFTIRRGDPTVSFSQHELDGFFQDELKLGGRASALLGIRYDWQSFVPDANNVSPRLAIAYRADARTVLRAGVGTFYERLPQKVTERATLNDGVRVRELVIAKPPFSVGDLVEGTLAPPSVVCVAPNLQTPLLVLANVSVERTLSEFAQVTAEYGHMRGRHLLRARNVNAPSAPGRRPDPSVLNVIQVESTAVSRSNALTLTLRSRVRRALKGSVQYTWSRTENDTGGAEPGAGSPFWLPADSFDLRAEYGRADFDQRHRFNAIATLLMPFAIRIGSVLTLASGVPFDITTGFDDNGDTLIKDRPPAGKRNTGRGPGFARLDLRVTKLFGLPRPFARPGRSKNFEVNVDAFNALNRVNYRNFIGSLNSPFFGRPNATRDARTLQLSAKYSF